MAIGDDAKRFRWDRKGDDLALIFAGGGLREAADLGHDAVLSLGSSRTSAASMRIGGQQGDGAAARRARSAAKDGAIRLSWLARNGGTPGEESRRCAEIGRAHVCTHVTNAHLVCRLLLEKK